MEGASFENGMYVFWHVVLDERFPHGNCGIRLRTVRPVVLDSGKHLRSVIQELTDEELMVDTSDTSGHMLAMLEMIASGSSPKAPDIGELGSHHLSVVPPGKHLVVTYDDYDAPRSLATDSPDKWRSYLNLRAFYNDEARGRKLRQNPAMYSFMVNPRGEFWEPDEVDAPPDTPEGEDRYNALCRDAKPPGQEIATWNVEYCDPQCIVDNFYEVWSPRAAQQRLANATQMPFTGTETVHPAVSRPHRAWTFAVPQDIEEGQARKIEWESPDGRLGCGGSFEVQIQVNKGSVELFFDFETAGEEPCIAGLFLDVLNHETSECIGFGTNISGSHEIHETFDMIRYEKLVAFVGI